MQTNLDQFDILHWMEGCAIGSHLRQGIWERAIDEFFPKLTQRQRETIYTYAKRDLSRNFTSFDGIPHYAADIFNQFLARYNPANQYRVTAEREGEKETSDAYKWKGKYYISSKVWISPDYITEIKHKPFDMCGSIMCSVHDTCARYKPNVERLRYYDHCDMYISKEELE